MVVNENVARFATENCHVTSTLVPCNDDEVEN